MKHRIFTVSKKEYKLSSMIGQGSHAHVWKAKASVYPYDEITIKISKPNEISQECIKNEIWFLKEVQHKNIPKLLDFSDVIGEGSPWFAMPLLQKLCIVAPMKGKLKPYDVSDICPKGYPLQASKIPFEYRQKTAIAVLYDISQVISYISGTGIIHADISPGNVMESRGSRVTKNYLLTDWGATALMHRYPENAFGSLHFTAPERLFGEVGSKTDLFSLGIMAYYILTGTVPYKGNDGEDYYLSTTLHDGVAPADLEKKTHSALNKLIKDLIRKAPENRPTPQDLCKRMEKIKAKFL